MMEVNYKLRFDSIPIGSRVDVTDSGGTTSGTLVEVIDDGVIVSWKFIEWQLVNGRTEEAMSTRSQFIPFEQIKTFGWSK